MATKITSIVNALKFRPVLISQNLNCHPYLSTPYPKDVIVNDDHVLLSNSSYLDQTLRIVFKSDDDIDSIDNVLMSVLRNDSSYIFMYTSMHNKNTYTNSFASQIVKQIINKNQTFAMMNINGDVIFSPYKVNISLLSNMKRLRKELFEKLDVKVPEKVYDNIENWGRNTNSSANYYSLIVDMGYFNHSCMVRKNK